MRFMGIPKGPGFIIMWRPGGAPESPRIPGMFIDMGMDV
jgi:hypothetical protein